MTEEDEGIRQSWAPGMERSVQRALQESEEEEGEGEEVEGERGRPQRDMESFVDDVRQFTCYSCNTFLNSNIFSLI